ncbi:hypothetical protein [Dysgonomonas termitidis]|uniref:Uncharacterized protein n=1 Tax=Dysgonomonas termitidis TaxID=1516126 RepID=A0ABV9KYP5_9BACT
MERKFLKTAAKKPYMIDNNEGINFSLQVVTPKIDGVPAQKELLFLAGDIIPDNLTKDGSLVISVTKDDARKLIDRLIRLADEL